MGLYLPSSHKNQPIDVYIGEILVETTHLKNDACQIGAFPRFMGSKMINN